MESTLGDRCNSSLSRTLTFCVWGALSACSTSSAAGPTGEMAGADGRDSMVSSGSSSAGQSGSEGAGTGGDIGGSSGAGGMSGVAGDAAGQSGGTNGSADAGTSDASTTDSNRRKLLLRDDGLSQLSFVDLTNPAARWTVAVPDGNDMQLVGGGRVMVATGNGYEEHDIASGVKVAEITSFPGTLSGHRLRTGNTLLAGVNWQGAQGVLLVEVNAAGVIQRKIGYPTFTWVRLVRETPQGTFLVSSNHSIFEGQPDGTVLWQALVNSNRPLSQELNAWKALRLPSGDIIVSAGFAANLQIFGKDHKVRQTITGPASVAPNFFSDFQVLANGNVLVANWEGHGGGNGNKGRQLLEFDPQGNLVWSWKQDPAYVSSLEAVIVLDGLDISRLHVEDTTGMLVPAP